MANLIPSLSSCVNRMQSGEKRFAWRIGTHLEDDYLCWYELPVGKRHCIRWHLFPEVRISTGDQGDLFPKEPDAENLDLLLPDIVKVMDMQQELLARSLGEGHRVIHGAVMIDEGHDFEPEWLKLVVHMVDPETNSLLLLYDDAQ